MTLAQIDALKSIIKEMRDRLEIDDFISLWGRDSLNEKLATLQAMLDDNK